ncbi:MAG: hypothetical protein ABIF10_08010 [Candidatus Woesearchaeota archaeon]
MEDCRIVEITIANTQARAVEYRGVIYIIEQDGSRATLREVPSDRISRLRCIGDLTNYEQMLLKELQASSA